MAKPKTKVKATQQARNYGKGVSPISGTAPPVEHQFRPGQSGNPGGRPKLLGESYRQMLARVDEHDKQQRTNAEIIADKLREVIVQKGDVGAAREIRSATEGDKLILATWQTEMVDALKQGQITAHDVIAELGREQAIPLLIAAGQAVPEGLPSNTTGKASQ